ncbi:uncharacterized protein LOC131879833 isoform X2 [Tigriopus californicus]|uniref:uncharacterized protein LOC131879833 isoform X2 n=1 Tax=Tigriopus californicus TaxID=6832 RepID=UPI0027DA46C3|nr:uncharacterized protein LOC131879833 isoform X2 [Tigriopus californicus]
MFMSDPDQWHGTRVALFYGLCSISMNFLNKLVVSTYEFNYPYLIMTCQMVVTVKFLDLLRHFGCHDLKPYSFQTAHDFLPASLCFALHSTLSLTALHGMNIPMYGAIKRCTPLVNLILSVVVLKKSMPSNSLILSILLITVGCFVAGLGDLQFDRHAYIMGLMSVLAQGGYLTLVQKNSESRKSTLEMVYVNGYNTLPFFITFSIIMGEPSAAFNSQSIRGCILTYSQFLCASVCSALTTSLVSVAKSVAQTVIGFVTFGGVKFHPLILLGITLNTLGGFIYTYIKYYEARSFGQSKKLRDVESGSASNQKAHLVELVTEVIREGMNKEKAAIHYSHRV